MSEFNGTLVKARGVSKSFKRGSRAWTARLRQAWRGRRAAPDRPEGRAAPHGRYAEVIHVLAELDLDIPEGEFLSLMGPSGSGKSTLLNLIGGLDRPDTGTVEVGGDRIDSMGSRKLANWRARHIGFVCANQFREDALGPRVVALSESHDSPVELDATLSLRLGADGR